MHARANLRPAPVDLRFRRHLRHPLLMAGLLLAAGLAPGLAAAGHAPPCEWSMNGVDPVSVGPLDVSQGGRTGTQLLGVSCPPGYTLLAAPPMISYQVVSNGCLGQGVFNSNPITGDDPTATEVPRAAWALLQPRFFSHKDPGGSGAGDTDGTGDDLSTQGWFVMVPNCSTYRISFCIRVRYQQSEFSFQCPPPWTQFH
jgi:hypothetical protein